jgi:hypothetical protein
MRRPRDVKQFTIRGRLCRRLALSAALGCASRRTPRRLRDQRIRIATGTLDHEALRVERHALASRLKHAAELSKCSTGATPSQNQMSKT